MKPVFTIDALTGSIKQNLKIGAIDRMSLAEVNQVLKNLECVGIEQFVMAEDKVGNQYDTVHTYRLSLDDVEKYINIRQMNVIYKKNLLHIDEDGSVLVVPVFEKHLTSWDKHTLDRCMELLEAFRLDVMIKRDKMVSKRRIGHYFINTSYMSDNCGRCKAKHLGFSNQFDDIFKLIENL